jgi:hypothetical protein
MFAPNLFKKILCAGAMAAAAALAGCEADGDPAEAGGIGGGGPDSIFPNDGSTPSAVADGGPPNGTGDGENISGRFICERSAKAYGPHPTTEVVANGLVGGAVSDLLELLGATPLTRLLNSVSEKENAIDGNIATYSTFALTVGLLGNLLSSVDQVIIPEDEVPAGKFAVFALGFPTATLELSLIGQIRVSTFLGDTLQERKVLTGSALDLLGAFSVANHRAFIGLRTTKPYDSVSVGILPLLISADVGEAMRVHELCTDGHFVPVP